jgi:hypothetical protein
MWHCMNLTCMKKPFHPIFASCSVISLLREDVIFRLTTQLRRISRFAVQPKSDLFHNLNLDYYLDITFP